MRRTRHAIMAAFAQLLEERPMNKITVKDIVDRCDVNRNTFYYHFQDIPSLLREMMETQVDGIIREHCALGRPMDCIEPALEYGLAHRQAVLHVYRAVPRELFEQYLDRLAQRMVDEYFDNALKDTPILSEDEAVLNRYYKCTAVGCLLDWLDAGLKYDLKAALERLCLLMDGAGERAIRLAAQRAREGKAEQQETPQ